MSIVNKLIVLLVIFLSSGMSLAQGTVNDQLIQTAKYESGEVVPYILTEVDLKTPKYALILMPGGNGNISPYMQGVIDLLK